MGRDARLIPRRRERTDQLTPQNIQAAAQKYLPPDRYTVLTLVPDTPAIKTQ
jgi:predicted Zn-dependent peptidase